MGTALQKRANALWQQRLEQFYHQLLADTPGSSRRSVAAIATAPERLTNRLQGKLSNLCVSLPREQLHNERQPSGEVLSASTNCCLLLAPSLPNSKHDDRGSSASQSVTSGCRGGSSPGKPTLLPSTPISTPLPSCLGRPDPDFQVSLVSVAVAGSHYTKPTQNSSWISLPADTAR